MQARLNQHDVTYHIEGAPGTPDDQVLLASALDLTANTPWAADGYTVAPGLPPELQAQLREGLAELVRAALRNANVPVGPGFDVSQYHHAIADDRARHLAVVDQLKEIRQERLPIPVAALEARISEVIGRRVQALNPWDGERLFHLRIIRPHRPDNNPLHRDVWLPDYADCLNLYLPVVGSTPDSTLPLVPGSHHWPESRTGRTAEGAVYNGVRFTVPALTEAPGPLTLVRPSPAPDELLVFSPYLLHGGAVNLNPDATRISLEMRFWAAD
jgi:hypothetical protein